MEHGRNQWPPPPAVEKRRTTGLPLWAWVVIGVIALGIVGYVAWPNNSHDDGHQQRISDTCELRASVDARQNGYLRYTERWQDYVDRCVDDLTPD